MDIWRINKNKIEHEGRTMHQRSWLAVKPILKSNPPPATPPMLGRWVSPEKTKKQKNKKTV